MLLRASTRPATLLAAWIPALVILLAHAPAFAVIRNWINAAGGSAATPGNWNPAGVLGAADNLIFPLSANYPVSFPSALVPTVVNHNYSAGVVNLSTDGTHTMTSSFGAGVTGTAGVNLTGGTIQARSLFLGSAAGLYGRLTVLPGGGFPPPPPPTFRTTDSSQPCQCGGDGTGRLEILGGSAVISAGALVLGNSASGRCTLIVSGRDPLSLQSSSLTTAGPALVGTFGRAIASLDNGAFLRVSGLTHVGNTPTGDGSILLGTNTATFGPSLLAEQALQIGDSGFPGQGGGRAFVQLTKGVVRVGGRTWLGDPDGNTNASQLRIDGGTFIAGGGFTRVSGTTFVHTAGILHVAGGTIVYPATFAWDVDGATARPELWVGTGSTSSLTSNTFSIGKFGQGLLRVVRPGTRLETTGQLYVGQGATGAGEMVVDSGAVVKAVDGLILGGAGVGTVTVMGGGRAEARTGTVGAFAGSQGTVLVTGAGSAVSCSTSFSIGALTPGPLTGTATVEAQGLIEVTAPGWFLQVSEGTGQLVVRDGGTARATHVLVDGLAELADGVVDGDDTDVDAAGTLRGHGDVLGTLHSSGVLDPAPSVGSFGTLRIGGAATLEPGSRLAIALGGPDPRNDSLRVLSGGLVLDGTLVLVADPSFVTSAGDTFVVATAPSITGGFDAVTWNGSPLAGEFDVVVQPTRVLVISHFGTVDAGPLAGAPTELRFGPLHGTPAPAFSLELPAEASVRVSLHDVMGRQVALVHDGPLAAGTHRLRAPASGLTNGVYFARAAVTGTGRSDVRRVKVLLLR